MSIHFNMGGPVMVDPTSDAPTTCVSFAFDVDLALTRTWRGDCMSSEEIIPNNVIGIPRGIIVALL